VGESIEYTLTGIWADGQHTNTATVTGDFVDGNGDTDTQTDSDAANYYGAAADIDDREVRVDPTARPGWTPYAANRPYLNSGTNPQFQVRGDQHRQRRPEPNVDLTDDVFGDISLDGTLAVGESIEYT